MSITEQRVEPKLTDNSLTVLEKRYLQKDEFGTILETPKELFWRVARATAEAERSYAAKDNATEDEIQARVDYYAEEFYRNMAECRFMPNTPTLFNTGVKEKACGSACFVLPLEDSMEGICDCVKWIALIQKEGGGIGVPLDGLRPAGSWIKGAKGYSSGPIAFWKALCEMTNAIQQGAKRRGACMAMMWYHHPDILKFIFSKQVLANFPNYNISVKVDEPFMRAVKENPDVPLVTHWKDRHWFMPHAIDEKINDILENGNPVTNHWPGDPNLLSVAYQVQDLIPCTPAGRFVDSDLDLKDVWTIGEFWETICRHAWKTGEPGLFFCDRMNDKYPLKDMTVTIPAEMTTTHEDREVSMRIESTNPCGEVPLPPFGSCNLLSINVAKLIRKVKDGHAAVEFDFDGLKPIVQTGLRFLDDIIDVNGYPAPEIDYIARQTRDVGLGVMGVADALYALGISYGSDEGIAFMEAIGTVVRESVEEAESKLVEERGAYPLYYKIPGMKVFDAGRRHVKATMNAPTGTISIIAGCSSGIEPLYALVFMRRVMRDGLGKPTEMLEVNQYFEQALLDYFSSSTSGDDLIRETVERIVQEVFDGKTMDSPAGREVVQGPSGSCQWHPDVPQDIKRVFVVAQDISPEFHVKAQAAWQKNFDSGVSKTVNLPHSATVEDVRQTYMMAYDLDCIGITVYRDGSRSGQPMSTKKDEKGTAMRETFEKSYGGKKEDEPSVLVVREPGPPEPKKMRWVMPSVRMKQETPFGTMHVHFVVDPSDRYRVKEIFAQLGRSGHMAAADLEAICRLVSLWLRSSGDWKHILRQLEGIGSALAVPTRDGPINSLPAALHNAISKFIHMKHQYGIEKILMGTVDIDNINLKESGSGASAVNPAVGYQITCPDCSGVLVAKEGCWTCSDPGCGYSRC